MSRSRLSLSTLLAASTTGRPGAAQARPPRCPPRWPDRHVDHEDDGVGLPDGPLGLGGHLLRSSLASPPACQPPVSTSGELPAGPLGVQRLAVPGDARLLLDDRLAAADDAVDQGGLADVGAADDGDDGAVTDVAHRSERGRRRHAAQRARRSAPPRPGAAGRRAPSRPGTGPGQAAVGEEVPPVRRAHRPARRQVGPGQQAGDGDVAPEELVAHGHDLDVRPAVARAPTSGPSTRAPYSPVSTVIARRGARSAGVTAPGALGRPVAQGRRTLDGAEEAAAGALPSASSPCDAARTRPRTRRHADAVVVLGEAAVGLEGGERPAGQQVVLVGGVDQAPAQARRGDLLPLLDQVDDGAPPRRRVGAHLGLVVEPAHAERHAGDAGQLAGTRRAPRPACPPGLPVVDPGHTTTWPWTSTPPSRSALSQRRLVAPRRLRSMRARTSGSVAWMDTNSGKALGEDPLEVEPR